MHKHRYALKNVHEKIKQLFNNRNNTDWDCFMEGLVVYTIII